MKKYLLCSLLSGIMLIGHAQDKDQKRWKKVRKIHEQTLTIDTHSDTPLLMLKSGFDMGVSHESPASRVDFPRMREGGLDAMFFAVFTGQKPRTTENYDQAYRLAHQMLDSIYSAVERNSSLATIALSASDAAKIERTGKRAIYIGMENGFPLGTDLTRVQEFYNRGVRYITLCHSFHNDLCDSSSDGEKPEHNGVSAFGREVIAEMNRLGMMIDCSHISDKSFYDVIQQSKAPVIASHSSVREVCRHDRNMNDDMIKTLARHGGVIQICLLDDYVKTPDTTTVRYRKAQEFYRIYRHELKNMTDEQRSDFYQSWDEFEQQYPKALPTVGDLVDHIDHVTNLVGVDHVGIGSDFDGGGGLADCTDVSQFPNITFELLKRGYSEEDIKKIWGGNLLRVFRQVEAVAGTLAESQRN